MFHRRQYAMAMDVFLQCVAHYTGLVTRPLPGISTCPSFSMSWPTRGGIGAEGFNTYAGGVVDAGAGASGAAAGAGDSAATGTYSGIGT